MNKFDHERKLKILEILVGLKFLYIIFKLYIKNILGGMYCD